MGSVHFNFRCCLYQRVLNREAKKEEKTYTLYGYITSKQKKTQKTWHTNEFQKKKKESHRFEYKSLSGKKIAEAKKKK